MADNLKKQHDDLLKGCSSSVVTSVKVELDSSYKRLHNSDAALRTWHEYLNKIKNVSVMYEQLIVNIEKIFFTIHQGIDQEACPKSQNTYAVKEIKQKISKLTV